MYIKFHRGKTMKRKVLAKQTDSRKIKFDENVILKYICPSILFAVLQLIYLVLLIFQDILVII